MSALDSKSVAFLSHSHQDKRYARELAAGLTAHGISVWFDEWQIEPGESIPEKIEEGLERCSHFVLVWSKAASESSWVARERLAFLHRAIKSGKRVIPVRIDEAPLPPLLADVMAVKARKVADALDALVGPGGEELKIRQAIVALGVREAELLARGIPGGGMTRCTKCGSNNVLEGSGDHGGRVVMFWTCGDCGEHLGDCV